MKKTYIIIVVLALLYIGFGAVYSSKAANCEQQLLATKLASNTNDQTDTGSNPVGKTFTTLLWPYFVVSDTVHHLGIFDCR